MSRCAGCGHEHGLVEGWCEECIANGKRDRARLGRGTLGEELSMALAESAREIEAHSWHPATLPLDDEHALPLVGHVYTDARGRRLKVDALDVGAKDGREVVGAVSSAGGADPLGVRWTPYSTTLPTWAAIWRDRRPPLDPSKAKIG